MPDSKSESQPAGKKKVIDPTMPAADEPDKSSEQLSPEEQMARYEKDLRENDWGHQPC